MRRVRPAIVISPILSGFLEWARGARAVNRAACAESQTRGGGMRGLALTRRSFLKAAAVTAAAAGLSQAATPVALAEGAGSSDDAGVKRIRTTCRGCGKMECGVWVTVQDGRAIKVESPSPCL